MAKVETTARKTTDAVKILDRMIGDDDNLRQDANEALINAKVAQLIYDVRTNAKLTQKQLGALIGTTQSVIARLEDADYEGHSLSMLQRIATALNKRLEIRFAPSKRKIAA
ncbi:MAG: XRE family transcriptional regulator [Verrucomicrobiota bacterium]